VSELEDGAKPTGPEPLLTCVQCLADYKESENAGLFIYINIDLVFVFLVFVIMSDSY